MPDLAPMFTYFLGVFTGAVLVVAAIWWGDR